MIRFCVFLSFLSLLTIVSHSTPTDFSCPTNNITNGVGVFPPNTQNLTYFPEKYFCNLQFLISDGYVVKFTLQANITNSTLDKMFIFNTQGQRYSFFSGKDTFYAPARNASFTISTITNSSRFWMKYEYINIANLTPIQLPIATPTRLNLSYTSQYTFTSQTEQLVLSTGSPSSWDSFTSKIYVYDGPDTTAPFLGTLRNYEGISGYFTLSSGRSLTLANYYNEQTNSWALVNEYEALSNVDTFTFTVITSQFDFLNNYQYLSSKLGARHAITYFLEDSDTSEVYLTRLERQGFQNFNGTLAVIPGTQPNSANALLNYNLILNDDVGSYLPQLIPCNLFTVISTANEFSLQFNANDEGRRKWLEAYPGRMGSVVSKSLWSPGVSPAYNFTFVSNTTLQFTFNIQSAVMASSGEQISVQIGSAGSAPFTTTFTHSVTNPGVRVANGTYMQVTYTGNNTQSSSIVTFEMESIYGKPMTTTHNTNSGSSKLQLLVAFLIASLLY